VCFYHGESLPEADPGTSSGATVKLDQNRSDQEIAPIQALRAFAAISVAVLHILGETGAMRGTPGRPPRSWLVGFPWEAGVDLFFVISGFVMVYSSRELFGAPFAQWLFLGRRMARIVPIYWGITTLFLVVAVAAPVILNDPFGSWQVVVASYLFLPWQRPDGSFLPVFRLGWTLNYEMLFYVIFAMAIRFRIHRAVILVSVSLLALVLFPTIYMPQMPQLIFWSDPIVLEFVFGMAAGWFVVRGGRMPRLGLLTGVAGLAALVINLVEFGVPRWLGFGLPASALLLACLVPIAPSWPLAALGHIGSASYAIYLIHLFIARAVREVWMRLLGPTHLDFYVVAALFGTVVVSLLVHNVFEVPATRLLRRLFGVGRSSGSAPTAIMASVTLPHTPAA
jgi:exopolysaccharide production protein ExoZ